MKTPKQLIITEYLDDFLDYYWRAQLLQRRNHEGAELPSGCGDPLQDSVSIYDTVERRFAGFSNVLRDLQHDATLPVGECQWPALKSWRINEWLYAFGVHRMTGSGASFYPADCGSDRHGYKNTCLFELAQCEDVQAMMNALYTRLEAKVPTFTCLGNQTPPFPKPIPGYRTGGSYYLCDVWPDLNEEIVELVQAGDTGTGQWSVAEITDRVIELNTRLGIKRFMFVLTAFAMDLADWYPQHVDPFSRCYYGANCRIALNAMFSDHNRGKSDAFYDQAMEYLCERLAADGINSAPCPMDVEDVACDAVRYWSRFVPKHGYQHLTADQRENVSRISRSQFEAFLATA